MWRTVVEMMVNFCWPFEGLKDSLHVQYLNRSGTLFFVNMFLFLSFMLKIISTAVSIVSEYMFTHDSYRLRFTTFI
jgi:hypothetical protein